MISIAVLGVVGPGMVALAATGGPASTWRGESSCTVKNTSCRDENVVYRIAARPDRSGFVSVSADKIVDGQAISMGTLEFRYSQAEQTLTCEYPQGTWHLRLEGDQITGTLVRPNGSRFRSVMLRRER